MAAQKGGVEKEYKLKFYPEPKSVFERFVGEIEQNTKARILQNELGDQLIWHNQWEQVKSYQGVQTRLPWNLKLN